MPSKSRYVLIVDNISSSTPARDIEKEFSYFGKIRDFMTDRKTRQALVEFDKAIDCTAAWKKMDGFRMDGREWKVDYATKDDFKFFGWRWYERSPSPPRRRSRSRSYSRSPSRSPARSPSPKRCSPSPKPRSPSPNRTPQQNNDDKREASKSPSPAP